MRRRLEAEAKLKQIYAARDLIAKAQTAFEVYKQFGNKAQMEAVHQQAQAARKQLQELGVDAARFQAGADLRAYYNGAMLKACEWDPSRKGIQVPLPQDESYLLLLRLAMEGGSKGELAQQQLRKLHALQDQMAVQQREVWGRMGQGDPMGAMRGIAGLMSLRAQLGAATSFGGQAKPAEDMAYVQSLIDRGNLTVAPEDIRAMQTYLKHRHIGLYQGEITGEYDVQFLGALALFQHLAQHNGKAQMWSAQGVQLKMDGMITKDWLNFASMQAGAGDYKKLLESDRDLSSMQRASTIVGIGDGVVSQLITEGAELLAGIWSVNPSNPKFYTETLPMTWEIAMAIASGELDVLLNEIKEQLGQEYVYPFEYIKKNGDQVWSGEATYEEAREFGKMTAKAIEAILILFTLGKTAVKLSTKLPESLMGPIRKMQKETADLKVVSEGTGNAGRYSGTLEKVNKPDAAADALADRIGGQSRVKFSGDSAGREFDAISEQYVAQSKPALQTVNKSVRDQMKATFEAAQETGRKVYYHFEGQPAQSVIDKLNEYSSRYGIDVVIDTNPLK